MDDVQTNPAGAATVDPALATQIYRIFIRATDEEVWQGITDPEFIVRYFHGSRVTNELRPGGQWLSRSSDGQQVWNDGEVLECDPPHRLVHTWRSMYDPVSALEPASQLTWEIEPQDGGTCLLTLTHDGLDRSPTTAANVSGAGWMGVLSGLKTLLETGEPMTRPE
jgi:uncharacterized protein YndB with AHSA1/START domain